MFNEVKDLTLSNNITVNLKQMSGDIISITYDSDKESIEQVIKRNIIDNGYRGYRFFLIKDEKYYSEDDKEDDNKLNDGDMLDLFISPKNFEVSIVFLEESLMYNSPNDMSAWSRGDFYNKYLISITEKYEKCNTHNISFKCDHYEYIFYNKDRRYIPSSSVIIINEGKYDDEDHIMTIEDKSVFSNINDMFDFLLRDLFEVYVCNDIKDKINYCWNTEEIKKDDVIYMENGVNYNLEDDIEYQLS